MTNKSVHLSRIDSGCFILVDSEGQVLGQQKSVTLEQSVDAIPEITVTFMVAAEDLIFEETNED